MDLMRTMMGGAALALGALLAVVPGCGDDETCLGAPNGPLAAGETYSPDACNTCTCNDDGSITCTEIACADCTADGNDYQVGDSWPAGDGCNLCQCTAPGEVSCTTAQCTN